MSATTDWRKPGEEDRSLDNAVLGVVLATMPLKRLRSLVRDVNVARRFSRTDKVLASAGDYLTGYLLIRERMDR